MRAWVSLVAGAGSSARQTLYLQGLQIGDDGPDLG